MRKRARTVLCGGRSAMVVPTASRCYHSASLFVTQSLKRLLAITIFRERGLLLFCSAFGFNSAKRRRVYESHLSGRVVGFTSTDAQNSHATGKPCATTCSSIRPKRIFGSFVCL